MKQQCWPEHLIALSENRKTKANQQYHSHHCIPSKARAVNPQIVGVIFAEHFIIDMKENDNHKK
jgi:hypothetical protein